MQSASSSSSLSVSKFKNDADNAGIVEEESMGRHKFPPGYKSGDIVTTSNAKASNTGAEGGGGGGEPKSIVNAQATSQATSQAPYSVPRGPNSGGNANDTLLQASSASMDAHRGTPPPQAQPQGINTVERNALISATGREFGPDIALKVRPNIVGKEIVGKEAAGEKIEDIINSKSSITEVLNILAFLLNNAGERKDSVITEFSYGKDKFGAVYDSLKDKVPFDINTLTLTLTPSESSASVASAETKSTVSITIPGTILKRDERCELKNDIILNSEQIQPLISACILQMINILENTREVFGGWAKLFKGMQGGSSKSKTKKTRRRY